MVKGISRRVVVVRPPESTVFEEAIFVLRESQDTSHDVLREACDIAKQYLYTPRVRRYSRKRWTNLHMVAASLASSGAVGLAWALTAYLC